MPSYRLDIEGWIPVEMQDGSIEELSLSQVFARASKIKRITGNPLEVAVLYRLLLAITHRVAAPGDTSDWISHWHDRYALMSAAQVYVEQSADHFDLYHHERPFGQHPELEPGQKPVSVLLYERAQGNNPVFFDASHEEHLYAIDSGTAARAMLVNFAFGGAHPDKSNPLSTGKENTMFAGPLCARLVAIVEGDALDKTLVLNLIAGEPSGTLSWEQASAPHPTKSEPDGICDRYTRKTRFIRLRPSEDGQRCLSVALHMGEQLQEDEERPRDPMIPLYLAKDKKLKVQRLDPDRALWRSSHVLFNCRSGPDSEPIRALDQLAPLVERGKFPSDERVSLRIVGVSGNAQGPKTDLWRDESLPFAISVVADERRFADLKEAISLAEQVATRLRGRVYDLAKAYISASVPSPDPADVGKLADELAPGLRDYWSAIAPRGERLALQPLDPETWSRDLEKAAKQTLVKASDRLPANAHRFRAVASIEVGFRALMPPKAATETT